MQEIQWYIVRDNRHSRNATDSQELTLSHKSQACTYMEKTKKKTISADNEKKASIVFWHVLNFQGLPVFLPILLWEW